MSKARQTALDADRKYLANNAYRFDGHDYLAAHLRKRSRDRMHTIVKEQQYLKKHSSNRGPLRFAQGRYQYFAPRGRPFLGRFDKGKRLYIRNKHVKKFKTFTFN